MCYTWPDVYVTLGLMYVLHLAWCMCYTWPGVCVAELAWSTVFQGPEEGEKKQLFVLLFVAMRNGDVVTWKIHLPFAEL